MMRYELLYNSHNCGGRYINLKTETTIVQIFASECLPPHLRFGRFVIEVKNLYRTESMKLECPILILNSNDLFWRNLGD